MASATRWRAPDDDDPGRHQQLQVLGGAAGREPDLDLPVDTNRLKAIGTLEAVSLLSSG